MDMDKREPEVSLKRMLFSVLYRWKAALAVAMVLAVLLGGVQGVRTWKSAVYEDPNAYQTALDAFEREKNRMEKRVTSLQNEVDHQRQYLDESVFMQLDYYDIHEAKVSLYIDSDYQILPGMEYQNTDDRGVMLNIYQAALTGDKILSEVAQSVGIETNYLKELVKITSSDDRIISIYVWHTDSQTAQQIRDLLLEQMTVVGEWITAGIGQHTMHAVTDSVGIVANEQVAELQEQARERLQEGLTELAEAEAQLQMLAAPVAPAAIGTHAVKAGVKWAVIGGLSGIFLVAVLSCCAFVFGDRVFSAEELQNRFGIKLLGGIWGGKKKCDPVTAWLLAAEGRVFRNFEENLDLIAANMDIYAGQSKVIICSGAQDLHLVEQLQLRLPGRKLIPCGSLVTNAAALRQLQECDGVLLISKRGISRYSECAREIERVCAAKKQLIGCIIVER